jgi:ferric-dicitrate binding protein FerR (iron transport regulator)
MAKALAENRLKGQFRKKALQDNLNSICETLTFNVHIKDMNFLKVA